MADGVEQRLRDLGEFIREQRETARLSLRGLSDRAGISNPYLSQIERGLRKPSADILQQIARGLAISAESLYVRAGILDPRDDDGTATPTGVEHAILAATDLDDRQKHVLIDLYRTLRRSEEGAAPGH
jgi:transcriptional regulator with XRE-family HTH domain